MTDFINNLAPREAGKLLNDEYAAMVIAGKAKIEWNAYAKCWCLVRGRDEEQMHLIAEEEKLYVYIKRIRATVNGYMDAVGEGDLTGDARKRRRRKASVRLFGATPMKAAKRLLSKGLP